MNTTQYKHYNNTKDKRLFCIRNPCKTPNVLIKLQYSHCFLYNFAWLRMYFKSATHRKHTWMWDTTQYKHYNNRKGKRLFCIKNPYKTPNLLIKLQYSHCFPYIIFYDYLFRKIWPLHVIYFLIFWIAVGMTSGILLFVIIVYQC